MSTSEDIEVTNNEVSTRTYTIQRAKSDSLRDPLNIKGETDRSSLEVI